MNNIIHSKVKVMVNISNDLSISKSIGKNGNSLLKAFMYNTLQRVIKRYNAL